MMDQLLKFYHFRKHRWKDLRKHLQMHRYYYAADYYAADYYAADYYAADYYAADYYAAD